MIEYFEKHIIALRIFVIIEFLLIISTIVVIIGCPHMILWFLLIGFIVAIVEKVLDNISSTRYYLYGEEKTFIWGTIWFIGTIILYIYFYNIGKYSFWRN